MGAYTGEISSEHAKDFNLEWALVGNKTYNKRS